MFGQFPDWLRAAPVELRMWLVEDDLPLDEELLLAAFAMAEPPPARRPATANAASPCFMRYRMVVTSFRGEAPFKARGV